MKKESKYAIMNGKEKKHLKTRDLTEEAYLQASQAFSDEFINFLDAIPQEAIKRNRMIILDKLDLAKDGIDTREFMELLAGLGQIVIELFLTLKRQTGLKVN